MRFIKKETLFLWDEIVQLPFKELKKDLLLAPLLCPPYYSKDFTLYLATSESTIGVVLVQEDDKLREHGVYYLSCALAGPKLRYSHVEKLALATVYVVQRLRHYILLRTTTVVEYVTTFQYVLYQHIIGGKFNN